MKTGDLNGASKAEFAYQSVPDNEKIVIVEEIPECTWVDEQRRLNK